MVISQLPAGTTVVESISNTEFIVADAGPGGAVLLTAKVLCRGCFSPAEPEADERWIKLLGRGDYTRSHIRDWLDRDFAARFPASFLDRTLITQVPCVAGSPGSQRAVNVSARFYLPSAGELGLTGFTGIDEGPMLPVFRDFRSRIGLKRVVPGEILLPVKEPAETENELACDWWLRTPHHRENYIAAVVHRSGRMVYKRCADETVGIRPLVRVQPDIEVAPLPDKRGYTLMLEGNGYEAQ